jgi:SH3 domain protein
MRKQLLLIGAMCGWTALAGAESAYVTDTLRLSLYGAADGSGDPLDNLASGAAVEVLERDTNYTHVRTAAGREGWVKTAFLVNTKPARARVAELEAEIADLKNDVAAARDAQHAAEEQLGKVGHTASTTAPTDALQVALDRLRRENRAYEERFETYRSTLPVAWVVVALVVTLVGGFAAGLWWLDSLIRRRHGGFRIY